MFAAIFRVDVLDHLLAALMFEIDVDVRRLVAFGRDEAIEQQCRLFRVHLGNPETIANGGIGGRSPPLTENILGAGKAGDDFWVKAEPLLYTALIGYIHYEAPSEEQNFSTIIAFIIASEVREDDEDHGGD